MEYMDAGSLDKLEVDGIPESVLGRITSSMVRGLKFLKDDMQIIHRGTFFRMVIDTAADEAALRCQANERPGEQKGRSQAMRFWRVRPVGAITRKDKYRLSELYGGKC